MKEIPKNKRVARQMIGLSALLLLFGIISLGGCKHRDITTGVLPGLPEDAYYDYYYHIEIDSAAACCGIDSFYIHAEWLQDEVNEFLKDSVQRKTGNLTSLYIWFVYDVNGEDYIYKDMSDQGFELRLYDCEGNVLPNNEINVYKHEKKSHVVSIEMGKIGKI